MGGVSLLRWLVLGSLLLSSQAWLGPPQTLRRPNSSCLLAYRRTARSPPPERRAEPPLSVSRALIAANVALHLVSAGNLVPNLQRRLSKVDFMIRRGEVYRLLTATFLHSSLPHLLFNCYSLYQVGPQAERVFGRTIFLVIYILSGVIANISTFLLNTSPMSLGASGCLFGIIGAFAAYFFRNRNILGRQAELGLESIKRTLLLNLLYSLGSNVDHTAHLFGFLGEVPKACLHSPLNYDSRRRSSVLLDRTQV